MADLSALPEVLLIEELARRARKRAKTKPDGVPYCEECAHYRYFTGEKYMPKNYNPCQMKHMMAYQTPNDDESALTGAYGFYRVVCEDREELKS